MRRYSGKIGNARICHCTVINDPRNVQIHDAVLPTGIAIWLNEGTSTTIALFFARFFFQLVGKRIFYPSRGLNIQTNDRHSPRTFGKPFHAQKRWNVQITVLKKRLKSADLKFAPGWNCPGSGE